MRRITTRVTGKQREREEDMRHMVACSSQRDKPAPRIDFFKAFKLITLCGENHIKPPDEKQKLAGETNVRAASAKQFLEGV